MTASERQCARDPGLDSRHTLLDARDVLACCSWGRPAGALNEREACEGPPPAQGVRLAVFLVARPTGVAGAGSPSEEALLPRT
jgi:hypothetical protein